MRQLKDIKVAISEKSTPKSIKNLQRTMLVAIAFIIGLAGNKRLSGQCSLIISVSGFLWGT